MKAGGPSRSSYPGFQSDATKHVGASLPWLVPLVVALLGLPFVLISMRVLTFTTFGRDQGIFQYVAWALRHGEVAYRDIHEINGPLPSAWHMLLQAAGGSDEHVFRTIDTLVLGAAYVAFSTTMPGWVGLRTTLRVKLVWALAGLSVLGAQYVQFDWWQTTQRESLYSWILFASLAFQSIAHVDKRRCYFILAGAFTALTWFGKPPCVVFMVLQILVLYLDRRNLPLPMSRALLRLGMGAAIVTIAMIAFLVRYADFSSMLEMLVAVPRLHHTIWNESLVDAYRKYGNGPRLNWLIVSAAAFFVVYRLFDLPRRALLALVLPTGGLTLFFLQGKAFPYHLHMAMLGAGVMQLIVLAAVSRAARTTCGATQFASVAFALGLGFKTMDDARTSSYAHASWAKIGRTKAARSSRAYYNSFPWGDFFPGDLRDAASYLDRFTQPEERVQTYGMDPYLLFLAKRKSATPVIYSFELQVEPALAGGSGAKPSDADKRWLVAYRDRAEAHMLERITTDAPAAFAFFDYAPFDHAANGEEAFARHCPSVYAFLERNYAPTVRIGAVRVRLRADVALRAPSR